MVALGLQMCPFITRNLNFLPFSVFLKIQSCVLEMEPRQKFFFIFKEGLPCFTPLSYVSPEDQ